MYFLIRKLKNGEVNYQKFSKQFVCTLLVVIFVSLCVPTVLAANGTSSVVRSYKADIGKIIISDLAVEDSNGSQVPIGTEKDFDLSISDILSGIDVGEIGAAYSALFENINDAEDGIVKNIYDVAGNSPQDGIDVVFVLDVSASMSTAWGGADSSGDSNRIAKVHQAAMAVLESNPDNRMAVVTFANQVEATLDFTSDLNSVDGTLPSQATSIGTNYEVGLNRAESLLNSRNDASRKSYVVLITDGWPNSGNAMAGANSLKNNTDAEVYCIGIQSDATSVLSEIATDSNHFRDCTTANEFLNYINQIFLNSSVQQSAVIHGELAAGVNLWCDSEHPIVIDGVEYTTIEAIPSGAMDVMNNSKSIQLNFPTVDSEGVRISYYTKISDNLEHGEGGVKNISIHNEDILEYYRCYIDGGGQIQTNDTPTIVALGLPTVNVKTSVLTAIKSSNKLSDSDEVSGKALTYGEEIEYTITVKNTGSLELYNLTIQDIVPEGTEYISSKSGILDNSKMLVYTDISSLSPGTKAEMSFSVRVIAKAGIITNIGHLELDLDKNDETVECETNTLVNLISNISNTTPLLYEPIDPVGLIELPELIKPLGTTKPPEQSAPSILVDDADTSEQGATDFDNKQAACNSWCFAIPVIIVLSIILTIQLICIASDIRVLKWYKGKKDELLSKNKQ